MFLRRLKALLGCSPAGAYDASPERTQDGASTSGREDTEVAPKSAVVPPSNGDGPSQSPASRVYQTAHSLLKAQLDRGQERLADEFSKLGEVDEECGEAESCLNASKNR